MAKRSKGKKRRPLNEGASGPFGASLGDLLRARGLEVPDDATTDAAADTAAPDTASTDPLDLSAAGRLRVHRERKGRRGKTVTLIEGLDPERVDLAQLARAMAKALGCGGGVEGDAVLLQGDMTKRATLWLRERGATVG